ncbi:hypothetical protein CHCC20441_3346 [Bacillus licheniformis]|nr:hypothetical protein CHCC5026_0735 [Bacillus licheniformis]TWK05773.1 hypothetical protein CHCC20441_3346 [Bacillus licheniformis]TWK18937.1 hypothetical protein CHCC20440_0873 [Bacillus licheniformis]TWK97451.1 hypothetical protein CHCC20325_1620 [Bacillus licheniformis]
MKREAENAYQEHDAEINDLKHDTYRQVGHGLYDKLTLEDVNNTLKKTWRSRLTKKAIRYFTMFMPKKLTSPH